MNLSLLLVETASVSISAIKRGTNGERQRHLPQPLVPSQLPFEVPFWPIFTRILHQPVPKCFAYIAGGTPVSRTQHDRGIPSSACCVDHFVLRLCNRRQFKRDKFKTDAKTSGIRLKGDSLKLFFREWERMINVRMAGLDDDISVEEAIRRQVDRLAAHIRGQEP